MEVSNKRLGLSIESVDQGLEGIRFGVVEESALLEEERSVLLATDLKWSDLRADVQSLTYIVSHQLADLGRTSILNRQDLDEVGLRNALGFDGGKKSLEVDAPVGAEPEQTLDSDDGSTPHKSPLGRLDMLFVQIRGQVVS